MRRAFALCGLLVIGCGEGINGMNDDGINRSGNNSNNNTEKDKTNNYYLRTSSSNKGTGNRRNYRYLSACIGPFRRYIAKDSGFYRVPSGQVFVVFDGGRGGKFDELTGGKYPGFDPMLEFTFQFDLTGLQDDCKRCKIQINEGRSCDDPMTRYWDKSVRGAYNPWRQLYGAYYTSDHQGTAKGHFSMFDGFNFDDHKQRTVVVFARDGTTTIGCGVLRNRAHGLCIAASDGQGPSAVPILPASESPTAPAPITSPITFSPLPTMSPSMPRPKRRPTARPTPFTPMPTPETSTVPTMEESISASPTCGPFEQPTRPPRPPVPKPHMIPPTWMNPPTKPPRPPVAPKGTKSPKKDDEMKKEPRMKVKSSKKSKKKSKKKRA